jgi:hypothetical protein
MKTPPPQLFHYTSQEGFLGITQSKKMWATHARYLNDSQEAEYAISLAMRELDSLAETDKHADTFVKQARDNVGFVSGPAGVGVYVTSFSQMRDQLSQWRGYCPLGAGFSLGFETQRLLAAATKQGFVLVPCIYEESEQVELIREIFATAQEPQANSSRGDFFAFLLLKWGVAIKNNGFKEEQEWRLVSIEPGAPLIRPGKSFLVPYHELSLAEFEDPLHLDSVTIGPTPHPLLSAHSVHIASFRNGFKYEQLLQSAIPFRNW